MPTPPARQVGRFALRLSLRLAGVALALVAVAAGGLVADGLLDDPRLSDVGIVPGSKVMPDGMPSARLQARLDEAVALYQRGLFGTVIVSGGTGSEGFSEARVMADYLIAHQVPATAVIVDEHGVTTQATAIDSAAIMRRHGFHSALVVTQYFHVTRSRYALREAGVSQVHTAHARYFEWRDLYSIAREVVAIPTYWVHSDKR